MIQERAKYKNLLLDCSELKGNGLAMLHKRATLLVEVFEDQHFRQDIGGGDFTLAGVLDKYVDDCALTFLQLRTILQVFPDPVKWRTVSLRSLYLDAMTSLHPPKVKDEPAEEDVVDSGPSIVRGQSIPEVSDEQAVLPESPDSGSSIASLRKENKELRLENAKLKRRVHELEEKLKRLTTEPAMA